MKARKPSKIVKPKVGKKKLAPTTKNHRFQSFNQRIAKLKIDPIRRRRNADVREELSEDTATYFGRSLDEWRDLNLSKTFTAFAREAAPLCDNLPVVLHNEEKIMDLLVKYIEQGDSLSLEPLLDLLSHFAHDLDLRFEKHFPRAVATITTLAASHSDPAVIEWSFTRLAWLFKYLSRVLTPDLRPLYDLMSPYLGKENQKPFIVRFASESMSFLIRKAAATYDSDPTPLDLIISHTLEDCVREAVSNTLYMQGIMTMLTEAIKGVRRDIHFGGTGVLKSVLKYITNRPFGDIATLDDLLSGILICLIHHTDVETFYPVLAIVLNYAEECAAEQRLDMIGLAAHLIFVVTAVRKGSRVAEWNRIPATLRLLVELGQEQPELNGSARQWILSAVATTFQTATIDTLLWTLELLVQIRSGQWKPYFLQFCDLFSRLGRERFQQFLLPEFQKFISQEWTDNADAISVVLPKLAPFERTLNFPEAFQSLILERLTRLTISPDAADLPQQLADADLALSTIRHMDVKDSLRNSLRAALLLNVKHALDNAIAITSDFEKFALGPCFATLLELESHNEVFLDLWPVLCRESSRFVHSPMFWSNLLRCINKYQNEEETIDWNYLSPLENSILEAVSLSSHSIRQDALEIARSIYELRKQPVPEKLQTAISIESTAISLESARNISMNIRRLASVGIVDGVDSFTQKLIPTYCFGILHFRLSQAWDDATIALAQLSKESVSEERIISLAQKWLDMEVSSVDSSGIEANEAVLDINSSGFQVESEFECPNLAKLSAICQQTSDSPNGGYPSAEEQFRADTRTVPPVSSTAREQALRVFSKIPHLAEKRSRMLVPFLLQWASFSQTQDDEDTHITRWSRKDQKALLAVLAQFTNPRVLYKADDVYAALLNLCANGDVEIQRSALKAIYAWKDPAIKTYEEHLNNLLDDARFRDEISVFLQSADGDAVIAVEHYDKLMPVLLRLLYGRAVAGGKHGQSTRRKAIFVALSRYGDQVLAMFVDIALGSTANIQLIQNNEVDEAVFDQVIPSARQQLGMVNMINDMLETMGTALEPFAHKILESITVCAVSASRKLESASEDETQSTSLLRSIRQVGLQCIVKVFAAVSNSTFPIHARVILDELFVPRQQKFAVENTQSISAMLRLFSVFASSQQSGPYLSKHSDMMLDRVMELLREPSAKDEVRVFILREILDNLVRPGAVSTLTQEHMTAFVQSVGDVLEQQPCRDVIDACVGSLTNLAPWIEDAQDGLQVLEVCAGLLSKPQKMVSLTTKIGLLKTLSPILDLLSNPAVSSLYESLCGLFSRMHDLESRALLSAVFTKVCKFDDALYNSAQICEDLNSRGDRLDEPDHARRERGFNEIFSQAEKLTGRQWQPILQNCLFYLRDNDDLVNRTSSSQGLTRFIDAASRNEELHSLVLNALLPSIERGIENGSELVRAEFLHLLGHLVESLPDLPAVRDMSILTIAGDDEASVFNNVLHIQQHRRLRALRRLADETDKLNSRNAAKIFIPLLEHFVFDRADGDAGRTLSDQAIVTIGALGRALNWSAFRAVFKRYVGYLSSKNEQGPVIMRLMSALVDNIASKRILDETTNVDNLSSSKENAINRDLLPPLLEYIHLKDESTIDRRMPVAVTVVKLLLLLPKDEMASRLPAVLTDVCQILRSQSQEARDQARKTLTAIFGLVGPSYLGFILKELRGALKRGSQLHVLSFTVHALLVNTIESYKPGDLDHCLPELATIIMDDIFGATGQEKDSEDYRSKLKEVKSSKSFDTMEILARVTPMQRLGQLVQPLRALLSESVDSKTLSKADALLIRLRNGVEQNPASQTRDTLIFCHEIIRQVHQDQCQVRQSKSRNGVVNDRYIIKPEPSATTKRKGAGLIHSFKLVEFALNLLRKVLRRHDDLMTAANLAGFLPIVGDAFVQGQEEIQISAIKMLSTIMRVNIPELEQNAPVYVKEALRIIKGSTSLAGDAPKSALDLLTAILREKRTVSVNEKDIGAVLKALKGDIDEPDRQGAIYKFLRTVLGRKVMITEVYEVMDDIGKAMITNADRSIRESARSAYVQFVLEYQHGKDSWNKKAAFFVENLKYEHAAGRQSMMELLNQLVPKLPDPTVEKLGLTLFVGLVPVHSSDADHSCRQMAGILIGKLFERVGTEQMDAFLSLLQKWTSKKDNPAIQAAAFQCWVVALRKISLADAVTITVQNNIADVLRESEDADFDGGYEVVLPALATLHTLIDVSPSIAFSNQSLGMWQSVHTHLDSANMDTREVAAKLIEEYFSHLASSSSKSGSGLSAVPLRGTYGLKLEGQEMRQICQSSLQVLLSGVDDSTEALATQTVRNLVFLGRCFAANLMEWHNSDRMLSYNGDEDGDAVNDISDLSAIEYLLNQLSYITRQENLPILSRTSAVQCQIALIKHIDEVPDIAALVKPLYLLTDPAVPKPNDEAFKALTDLARELLDAIQQKSGTDVYLSALGEARSYAKSRREDRRQKRKIAAVSAPEQWAKAKKRKHEMQRAKSKTNALVARGQRRGW